MVFSEDIQTGPNAGELVIKDHATEKAGDGQAGKTDGSAHHEIVELRT